MATLEIITDTPAPVKPLAPDRVLPCPGKDESPAARWLRLAAWGLWADLAAEDAFDLHTYWVESGSRPGLRHRVEWHHAYPVGWACGCEYSQGSAARLCTHIARLEWLRQGPDFVAQCPCCGGEAWVKMWGATGACLCPVCLYRDDLPAELVGELIDWRGGWGEAVRLDQALLLQYIAALPPDPVDTIAHAAEAYAHLYGGS